MLRYVHPVLAGVTVVALVYVGSLGLRARSDRRHAPTYLTRHARLAPFVYVIVLVAWAGGIASTWLLRPDLELAASAHFRCGGAVVLALSGSALSARRMELPAVRAAHPWFGAAAILLAAAQVFFGLQITP